MSYATIYDLDGYTIADGIQSQAICDATITTARWLAIDKKRSVIVEDRGTSECYRITPSGRRLRPPPGWKPTWEEEG